MESCSRGCRVYCGMIEPLKVLYLGMECGTRQALTLTVASAVGLVAKSATSRG